MAKSFRGLLDKMSPERRERVEDRVHGMLVEMALQELRESRQLTQVQLAASLEVNQAAISKMEGQSDMYLSTLRRLVGAMGGKLKLIAEFPDQEIVINQFEPKA